MARDQPHHTPPPHTTHQTPRRRRTPARSGGDRPPTPAAKPSQEWRGVAHRNLRQEWRGTNHTTHQPQSERPPREGKGRNSQAAPPPPKKKQPTATKPPANNTKGGHTPRTEGTEDRTPKEAQGDHPAETGNTKPGTAAHREKGHRNKQTHTTKKRKTQQPSPKERGCGERPQGPGQGHPATGKKKAQKTHPDNPAKKGGAHPRPVPSTHAYTAHRNRKRRGASETRTKPNTSLKRADTKAQPRTPQTAAKRGTTPQTEPKHTHPRPGPRLAGVNKIHTQPQPGPYHKHKPTVGNPVPTARALRQPEPCR